MCGLIFVDAQSQENTSVDIHSLEYRSAGIGSKNDLLLRGWAGLGLSGSFKRSKRSSIHDCGAWSKLNCTQIAGMADAG